jgi:hypothetical protein
VVYAVAAVAYLLGAAAVALASRGRWPVVTVVGVTLAGLVTLLPVEYFGAPIIVCEGVGDGDNCYLLYGRSSTLIGFTVQHLGDLDGPYLSYGALAVIGLMVTAVATLVAAFLVNRSARLRRT